MNTNGPHERDRVSGTHTVTDAAGNATPGDPGDGTTTYGYDAINRPTSIDYSDSTPDVGFGYDANNNRTSMTDGHGTETYTYDSLDRLTAVSRGTTTMSYDYNATSQVTKRTYAGGVVVDYTYDDDSLLDTVTSAGAVTDYDYDATGSLKTTTLPGTNGHVETRAYDLAGRLTEVENAKAGTVLSRFTYALDDIGNPTTVTDKDGAVTSYSYDPNRDFLTEVCYQASCPGANDPFIRYAYDPVGNRTEEIRPAGTTTYAYDAADRITSSTGPSGTTTYSHDANGNLTQAGGRTFAYDLANRMTSTTSGPTTTTYTYDGDGKRLKASTGAGAADTTNFLWDPSFGLPELVRESDGADSVLRRYVHGHSLISMTANGDPSYYHYDDLGSVRNVTSASGAPRWSYSYEPFGSMRNEVKVDQSAPDNSMKFTGEHLDPTGLYHLRARQYDSGLGRFTARDPLTPGITDPYVSAYVYANDRPTALTDPSGMIPFNYESESVYVPVGPALQILGIEGKIYVGSSNPAQATESSSASSWLIFFNAANKHFVTRHGRPGFHWGNHSHRIEWDPRNKWHYNSPRTGRLHPKPWEAIGGMLGGGEVMIVPPAPPSIFCNDVFGPNPCEENGGIPPA